MKPKCFLKKAIALLLGLLLVNPSAVAWVMVEDLYQDKVFVKTQDSRERQLAINHALLNVLVKVSGDSTLLDKAMDVKKLAEQQTVVESFSYESNTQPQQKSEYPYQVTISFEPQTIHSFLQQLDHRAWVKKRPELMIWLALEDNQDQTSLLTTDHPFALAEHIEKLAKKRGIPLIFPMLDIDDLDEVTFSDVWQLKSSVLHTAMKRYGAQRLLVGRIKQQPKGWQVRWSLVSRGEHLNWSTQAESIDEALSAPLDQIFDTVAQDYSFPRQTTSTNQTSLTISDVVTVSDYTKTFDYLQSLPIVKEITVLGAERGIIAYRITLAGPTQQLQKTIAQRSILRPLYTENEHTLHYQLVS